MNKKDDLSKEYKNKRYIFTQSSQAPFMQDFFEGKDITSIIKVIDSNGDCAELTRMLNCVLRVTGCHYSHLDNDIPNRADKKNLFKSIIKSCKQIEEDLQVLLNWGV